MKHLRPGATLACASALIAGTALAATAEPLDLEGEHRIVVGNTVWDLYTDPVTLRNVSVYSADLDPETDLDALPDGIELVNHSHNDLWWAAFISSPEQEDADYYGNSRDGQLVVDMVREANGDVVLTGPVEDIAGLEVAAEYRFYADGDLVRVLLTVTNPADAPVEFVTGTESYFDDGYGPESTASGDATLTTVDRWAVFGDGGTGGPVLTMAWQGVGAEAPAERASTSPDGEAMETAGGMVIGAGETITLAYYTAVTAYEGATPTPTPTATPMASAPSVAFAPVADSYAAALATARAAANEFDTFDGRLTAGLAPGDLVLNWGTVPAVTDPGEDGEGGGGSGGAPGGDATDGGTGTAGPATPVVAEPNFTG